MTDVGDVAAPQPGGALPATAPRSGLREIAGAFLALGSLSFGGPIAHLGYLRAEFVARRKWLEEAEYADLVALCQFLPGPASSQVVFALGMRRGGLAGAIVASLCFTLPSALLMIAFAYGVAAADLRGAGWLHGLKLAAVAVVAQAVWSMGRNLCPDRARLSLALAAAAALLAAPGALLQIGVIAFGALAGAWLYRREIPAIPVALPANARAHRAAAASLAVFFALLALAPLAAAATDARWIDVFDGFYRAGSLVFGGGHVVLPLLRAEVVPPAWIADDRFLAGYGAAQALPGPLFTFAGYLGAAIVGGPWAWLGGLWGLFAVFLPAWLLIGGALPFWHSLRARPWTQATLRGANAAVVGVLLAALYQPVFAEGVKGPRDLATAFVCFGLLEIWKAPPWLVVLAAAAAGQWLLH